MIPVYFVQCNIFRAEVLLALAAENIENKETQVSVPKILQPK